MKEFVIRDPIIDEDVGLIIRPMEDSDVTEASLLEQATFSMPWKADDFLEMVRASYAYYYVAEVHSKTSCISSDKLVGIAGLRDISGEGEITNIAVDKAYRGLKIGKALIQTLVDKCDELNISDVTLEVRVSNKTAINLYESFGFVSEGIRPGFYEKPTEDAMIMWRRDKGKKC